MTEGERLRYLRKELLGLTLDKFGERIGIQKSGVSKIERGENGLSEQIIKSICREFHVSESWLRTGEGEPFEPDPEDELAALAKAYSLNDKSMVMIREFVTMEQWKRDAVIEYAERVASDLLDITEAEQEATRTNDSRKEEWEEEDIEKQVEAYRMALEKERRAKAKSQVS